MKALELRAAGAAVPYYVPDDEDWPPPDLVDPEAIARRVVELLGSRIPTIAEMPPTLSTTEAMRVLGYHQRTHFMAMVRRNGIPFERISSRKFLFSARDIEKFRQRRRVGRPL